MYKICHQKILRPCHSRQFVFATCNAIFAENNIAGCNQDVRRTYVTCFATCNEIILNVRREFKNDSGILIMSYCDWFLLKQIAKQFSGVCHTPQLAAYHCEKQKMLLLSLQLATRFFIARPLANMGCHTRKSSLQLAMQRTPLRCKLQ